MGRLRGGDGAAIDAGAGRDSEGEGACSTLSLHDCRLRTDCATTRCVQCDCTVQFSCWGVDDGDADGCPDFGCKIDQPCCEADGTCGDGFSCAPPGTPAECGACIAEPGDCTEDGMCAAGDICEPVRCHCSGESACVAGCTDDSCPVGEVCAAGTHPRCEPASCDGGDPCPDDFDCVEGTCERRACEADEVCDGYCVAGLCYPALGECRPPGA